MFDFLKQQPIPEDFDYKRQKRKIGQKAEAANQLRTFRPTELQLMPGGWTAGGMTSPLSTIATIAANVAGAKLLANSQKEQDALDEAGDKLYRQGVQALKDVRDDPTGEQKKAAQDVRDLSYFADDPLLPYDIKDKTPEPVAQTSPVATPATVEAKPLEPAKTPARRALPRSTGSGRGGQGGPTAAELAAHNAVARIDAENLKSPMQVFPANLPQTNVPTNDIGNGMRIPVGQPLDGNIGRGVPTGNIGRDAIGPGGQLTPQQIERMAEAGRAPQIEAQVKTAPAGVSAATAARTAASAAVRRQVEEAAAREAAASAAASAASAAATEEEAITARQFELDTLGKQYRADNQQEVANFAERKGKVLARSIQDRTEEAKTMLSRSGERGQKLVDAMDTAMLNNLLSPEDDRKNLIVVGDRLYNVKTRQFVNDGKPQVFKEGDFVQTGNGLVRIGGKPQPQVYKEGDFIQTGNGLVRVGGDAGPKIKAHFDTPEGMKVLYEDGTTQLVDRKSTGATEAAATEADKVLSGDKKKQIASSIADMVNTVIASGDVERAGSGLLNTAGNFLNRTIGAQSGTAEARSRIDALKSRMAEHILTKFSESGMSPNRLADTKRELELHIASVGNFDYERLSPDALKVELDKIGQQMILVATQHPYKASELGAGRGAAPVNTQRSPGGLAW
jgi:hypothetical protein